MIITIAAFKGGVGKSTTALHIASYLQTKAATLLVDGDANRSALGWAKRGDFPFKVVDEMQAVKFARKFDHIIIDTPARPKEEPKKEEASTEEEAPMEGVEVEADGTSKAAQPMEE